jgi:integrase
MPSFAFTARSKPPIPSKGQIDYWDSSVPGFGQRVSSGGTRAWIVMYRYNAKKRRMKLGSPGIMSLAAARDAARVAVGKAESGLDPATEKRQRAAKADTVSDLAGAYIEQYAKPRKRSWKKDQQILAREVLPVLGRKRVADVSRRDIREVLQPIVDRRALVRANHTLEVVRKMFNWAIETRDLTIINPAARISKPATANSRRRYLSEPELKRFWLALDAANLGRGGSVAFKLMMLTAQREMEVVRMRWADVDWNGSIWTIPAGHAKNQLEHAVPLPPLSMSLLRDLRDHAGSDEIYVFPSPVLGGQHVRRVFIEKRVKKIRMNSGIEDVTPHDLRRTATTYFGQLKVPQLIKKKVLHHERQRRSDVTDIYDRYEYLDEKRDALTKWEQFLLGIVRRQHSGPEAAGLEGRNDSDPKITPITSRYTPESNRCA